VRSNERRKGGNNMVLGNIKLSIDKSLNYRVEGKFECTNCGRTVDNIKVPKGTSITQYLKEESCKNCGMSKFVKKGK